MQEVHFREGEVIFSEGDVGEHCFKIVSGKVDIVVNVPRVLKRGHGETVATAGPGEFVGDMSVIQRGPRSASAVAVEPTVCMAYTADEIVDLLESDPKEALAYARLMIQRLRNTNRRMSWIAGQPR